GFVLSSGRECTRCTKSASSLWPPGDGIDARLIWKSMSKRSSSVHIGRPTLDGKKAIFWRKRGTRCIRRRTCALKSSNRSGPSGFVEGSTIETPPTCMCAVGRSMYKNCASSAVSLSGISSPRCFAGEHPSHRLRWQLRGRGEAVGRSSCVGRVISLERWSESELPAAERSLADPRMVEHLGGVQSVLGPIEFRHPPGNIEPSDDCVLQRQ